MFLKYSPNLVFLCVFLNSTFVLLGLNYIYVGLALFSTIGVLLSVFSVAELKKSNIIWVFIFFIFAHGVISCGYFGGAVESLRSLMLFIFPLGFWVVYFSKYPDFDWSSNSGYFYLISLTAFFGIFQYFFSPDLVGIIPNNLLPHTEPFEEKPFLEYIEFFRASSTTGSPQVYGLIVFLSAVLFKERSAKVTFHNIIFALLVFSSMLSGSKLVMLLIVMYFSYKMLVSRKGKFIFFGGLILVTLFASLHLNKKDVLDNVRLSRMLLFQEALQQEARDSRLQRYKYILVDTPVLTGSGAGYYDFNKLRSYNSVESQYFKFYGEYGVIGFILLQAIFLSAILVTFVNQDKLYIVLVLTYLAGWLVQALESPFFFHIWGVVVYAHKKYSVKSMFNENFGKYGSIKTWWRPKCRFEFPDRA
ncbi:MAG: hypothetical protein ACERJ1_12720 [Halodesulfovibrio sp.]|uniref:hypothetical protein n=1 Tax=Halodesulfovibrio sp. TaxID=1912772 RepID=UPI00359E6718